MTRVALVILALLVVAGVVLRLLLMRAHAPAFLGSLDSRCFLIAGQTNLFVWAAEPLRGANPWPAGYPAFLALVYKANNQLSAIVVAQHALGVLTAVLWYMVVRLVVSPLWALIPAAVILLAGPEIFLEHAVFPEALFSFLVAAMAYCTIRGLRDRPQLWGILAGLLAAGSGCVRVIGLTFIPLVALTFLIGLPGDLRRRLLSAAVVLVAAGGVIGVYLAEMKRQTGFGGPELTRAGSWGAPGTASQPRVDYLSRVGNDFTRYWRASDKKFKGGYNYDGLISMIDTRGPFAVYYRYRYLTRGEVENSITSWYFQTALYEMDSGLKTFMYGYERLTRVQDVRFLLLLLAALGGLVWGSAWQRRAGAFTFALAATSFVIPVLYVFYDARYAVPGYGPLAAAGAIGGAAVWARVVRWRKERAAREPALAEAT